MADLDRPGASTAPGTGTSADPARVARVQSPSVDRDGLRILVISPSCPYPPTWGFAKRVFHLLENLALRHRVTILSYVPANVPDDELSGLADHVHELVTVPSPVRDTLTKRVRQGLSLLSPTPFHAAQFRDSTMQDALDALLAREQFDVVQLESSQVGWLRFPAGIPVVVDEHNIESELLGRMGQTDASRLRRLYNRWEYVRYRAYEERVWRSVAACAATSQRDADAFAAKCPKSPVVVVPNGVDPEEFRPSVQPTQPDTIIFTGLLAYRPNEDGIRWFLEEVLPIVRRARPQARMTVVGGGPEDLLDSLRGPGVDVTGWVPDVRPLIDAAAVAVVPLRMGGGTRLKVVEAMSMSKAIVSTSLGAEGIDVVSGRHLELADDPQAFADAVVSLLDDPERGARLGSEARRLVEEEYSWATAAQRLEELLLSLVARSDEAGRPAENDAASAPGSPERGVATR